MEDKERLEKLKQEAIENPLKKKRGCTSCKKKKEQPVEELPVLEDMSELFTPTNEEIKLAYVELGSKELTKPKMDFINSIYQYLFKERFDFTCGSCASTQARKFHHHITNVLNIKL